MGATGTTTIDFGAFPGKLDTSVAVTGQASIIAGSLVEAWIRPVATALHSADEHVMATTMLEVIAGNIIAGTGFTIYGLVRDSSFGQGSIDGNFRNLPRKNSKLWGTFTVAWAWV
jgi:hypothetical protein